MKITLIGGGSKLWAFGFVTQFINSKYLSNVELILHDIDVEAAELICAAGSKYNAANGNPVKLVVEPDLRKALKDADFVAVSISTGGFETMKVDIEIPDEFGIYHTVGDTVGPGGFARAARNIPVFQNLAELVLELCPDCWFINVSNPLSILTRVADRMGVKAIGLCPGAVEQMSMLAELAGFGKNSRLDYTLTGIDHGSWATRLYADGNDVLAKLKEDGFYRSDGKLPVEEIKTDDPMIGGAVGSKAVFALWREYGFMPAIGDRHTCENFPFFNLESPTNLPYSVKRTFIKDRIEQYNIRHQRLLDYVTGANDELIKDTGHGQDPLLEIIESLSGKRNFHYTANYANIGQIPGFPERAIVETRALYDCAGVHPEVSPMPQVLQAVTLPHALRQEAVIDVVLRGNFDQFVAIVHSDPMCAKLSLTDCRKMMRKLLNANHKWIKNKELLT